jgi:hypothetical protein
VVPHLPDPPEQLEVFVIIATPYRYDPARVGPTPNEQFTHAIHGVAIFQAMSNGCPFTMITSCDVAATREVMELERLAAL